MRILNLQLPFLADYIRDPNKIWHPVYKIILIGRIISTMSNISMDYVLVCSLL
jgi:hypothetical protein